MHSLLISVDAQWHLTALNTITFTCVFTLTLCPLASNMLVHMATHDETLTLCHVSLSNQKGSCHSHP